MIFLRNLFQYDQVIWDRCNIPILTNRVIDYISENKEIFQIGHATVSGCMFLFGSLYEMPLEARAPILLISGISLCTNMILCALTQPNGFMPSGSYDDTEYVEAAAYGIA